MSYTVLQSPVQNSSYSDTDHLYDKMPVCTAHYQQHGRLPSVVWNVRQGCEEMKQDC